MVLALKPGCLSQGTSVWDAGRDGWVLCAVGLPRMCSQWGSRHHDFFLQVEPLPGATPAPGSTWNFFEKKNQILSVELWLTASGDRGLRWHPSAFRPPQTRIDRPKSDLVCSFVLTYFREVTVEKSVWREVFEQEEKRDKTKIRDVWTPRACR